MINIDGKDMLSVKEYAELHGIRPESVTQRIRRGTTSAVKIGRDWFIEADEPFLDARVRSGKYVGWRK